MIRALAPALAAGTSVVVKMPSQAAQVATLSSEIIASVPEITSGIVNIFVESGAEGSKFLVDCPDVPAISFTGSSAVGREIGRTAAAHFKRIGLELGGKSPHLVFDDADLNLALPKIEKSITVFGGQFCLTAGRLLVQRGIADAVRRGLAEKLERVKTGPASDPTSDMGPLIDRASVHRVNAMVEDAIAAGARVIVRGGPVTDGALACGAFYRPTLLEVADPKLAIVRSEVFGAVQTLQVFDTEEEAVNLANDSDYGLGASIWSENVDRPMRVARRLDVGMVFINDWATVAAQFEVGGVKHSGRGRLGGLASLDDFLEYKQITQTFRCPPS
jgi:betaine-aldehyde dehydrogenase